MSIFEIGSSLKDSAQNCMKFIGVFFFFILYNSLVLAQYNFTLSGTLTNSESGEIVNGALVKIDSLNISASTNSYGFYSLSAPMGLYEVEFSSPGLETFVKLVELTSDRIGNYEFLPRSQVLNEVVIEAKKTSNVEDTKIGQIELSIAVIKNLPSFMGEVDVLKSIQLLPGVSSVSEGGQGFYVRGGGPDQNLVLLDEAVVYNASHLLGFFSVFNSDAVKSVNLIKGGMPANFGGRMSSVLEVNMNEGNSKKMKVTGGLGLISSRLTIEGPLKKDKGSFIISGRRTYIDVLMKAFIPKTSSFSGTTYFFYDFNFKANYRLGPKDKVYLSAYYGQDKFKFGNEKSDFSVDMPWGNGIASLRWNHIFSTKLFLNVTTSITDYQFSFGSTQSQYRFKLSSGIRDLGAKVDFSYYLNNRHKIKYGLESINHTFTPTSVALSAEETDFDTGIPQRLHSYETAFYVLDEVEVNKRIKLNAGLRYSMYHQVGPFTRYVKGNISQADTTIESSKGDLIQFYNGWEPRFTARYLIDENSSIKMGYSYNYQYVHLTSLSAVSLPTDIWYPSTSIVKPQKGWLLTVGYFRDFFKSKYETSVEVYYKAMDNLIEYQEGVLPQDNVKDNTDNILTFGKGWSYGAEFFVKRNIGKFTGWIGYTWAKTERKFAALNEGKVFPAKYDRRHDLSLVGMYKLNDRWSFSTAYVYATGNTITLPTAWYVQDQNLLFDYGSKNSTRMAPYHRLDISATWYGKTVKTVTNEETGETFQVNKKCKSNWAFSVYNVYNRANPYFLYVDNTGAFLKNDFKIKIKQISLFPVLPSVTWNFEF